MGKMECPECGNEFDDLDMTIGDNGNPICIECFQKKNQKEDEKEKDDKK